MSVAVIASNPSPPVAAVAPAALDALCAHLKAVASRAADALVDANTGLLPPPHAPLRAPPTADALAERLALSAAQVERRGQPLQSATLTAKATASASASADASAASAAAAAKQPAPSLPRPSNDPDCAPTLDARVWGTDPVQALEGDAAYRALHVLLHTATLNAFAHRNRLVQQTAAQRTAMHEFRASARAYVDRCANAARQRDALAAVQHTADADAARVAQLRERVMAAGIAVPTPGAASDAAVRVVNGPAPAGTGAANVRRFRAVRDKRTQVVARRGGGARASTPNDDAAADSDDAALNAALLASMESHAAEQFLRSSAAATYTAATAPTASPMPGPMPAATIPHASERAEVRAGARGTPPRSTAARTTAATAPVAVDAAHARLLRDLQLAEAKATTSRRALAQAVATAERAEYDAAHTPVPVWHYPPHDGDGGGSASANASVERDAGSVWGRLTVLPAPAAATSNRSTTGRAVTEPATSTVAAAAGAAPLRAVYGPFFRDLLTRLLWVTDTGYADLRACDGSARDRSGPHGPPVSLHPVQAFDHVTFLQPKPFDAATHAPAPATAGASTAAARLTRSASSGAAIGAAATAAEADAALTSPAAQIGGLYPLEPLSAETAAAAASATTTAAAPAPASRVRGFAGLLLQHRSAKRPAVVSHSDQLRRSVKQRRRSCAWLNAVTAAATATATEPSPFTVAIGLSAAARGDVSAFVRFTAAPTSASHANALWRTLSGRHSDGKKADAKEKEVKINTAAGAAAAAAGEGEGEAHGSDSDSDSRPLSGASRVERLRRSAHNAYDTAADRKAARRTARHRVMPLITSTDVFPETLEALRAALRVPPEVASLDLLSLVTSLAGGEGLWASPHALVGADYCASYIPDNASRAGGGANTIARTVLNTADTLRMWAHVCAAPPASNGSDAAAGVAGLLPPLQRLVAEYLALPFTLAPSSGAGTVVVDVAVAFGHVNAPKPVRLRFEPDGAAARPGTAYVVSGTTAAFAAPATLLGACSVVDGTLRLTRHETARTGAGGGLVPLATASTFVAQWTGTRFVAREGSVTPTASSADALASLMANAPVVTADDMDMSAAAAAGAATAKRAVAIRHEPAATNLQQQVANDVERAADRSGVAARKRSALSALVATAASTPSVSFAAADTGTAAAPAAAAAATPAVPPILVLKVGLDTRHNTGLYALPIKLTLTSPGRLGIWDASALALDDGAASSSSSASSSSQSASGAAARPHAVYLERDPDRRTSDLRRPMDADAFATIDVDVESRSESDPDSDAELIGDDYVRPNVTSIARTRYGW